MKYKSLIMTVVWWIVSLFLIILGIAGLQAVGLISAVFFFIAIFINPLFTKSLKKRFYYETTDSMKAIAILLGLIVFALIKLHVLGIAPKKTNDVNEANPVSTQNSTLITETILTAD
ncbi:MAG: hypothetical protein WCN92_08390 [Eubacteriales bacterium]